ncbi:hypothetical protein [Marinobacterium rhizophilum]|uniref:Uncharacterized protein n=1 Tax=Marinobacterium rhizophilum TaxID=420402 RepID=A0ABY5HPV9_9GAMM|nr:hypothetical protein [Marinobacterium rhizophilum]UTW13593.1 hypothetical protein KDW95_08125 [Marinobacterium rhizophilum]
MSDNQDSPGALLDTVRELRGLLLDYIAGGPARAPRYKVLRDGLMADAQVNGHVPALVLEHENLNDLWQFMKYKSASKVERQELIRKQFDDLARSLSGAPAVAARDFEAIPVEKLFKGWYRLSQDTLEPQRLLSTARKIAVQVCSSIVDAHYHSGEIRGGNDDLTQVFGMTKDVLFACSTRNDQQLIVTDVVAGAVALLKSFEGIQERITLPALDEQSRLQLARMGVDAVLSAVMSLLSCWYMLQPSSPQS